MSERRERKRERARGEPAWILHYQKARGELSIKQGKNRGADPEVNKRLYLRTFFDSTVPAR